MDKGLDRPRRRGRPPLPDDKGKRYNLGIRTTKELKDLVEAAADSSGRSVAQEIETRLLDSFRADDPVFAPLLTALADAMNRESYSDFLRFLIERDGRGGDAERWYRWQALAADLVMYRAKHPIEEPDLTRVKFVNPWRSDIGVSASGGPARADTGEDQK